MASASPTQESINTFTRITGASESVALRKLEEYGGNLNEAVNSYFNEGARNITNPAAVVSPQYNTVNTNNQIQPGPNRLLQFLSTARSFKPSSLLDPNYRRNLLNEIGASAFTSQAPYVPHTGAVMGVPEEYNSGNEQPYHPGTRPLVYDGNTTSSSYGFENQGNVSTDNGSDLYGNNIEEEMIQAAIEASKQQSSSGIGLMQRELDLVDDEFSRAISLSLKTAEQEKAMRDQGVKDRDLQRGLYDVEANKTNMGSWEFGNSSLQEGAEVVQERPPVSVLSNHDASDHPQRYQNDFPSDEWGGISSRELDESVMLEAAIFGEIPESTSHHSKYEPHLRSGSERSMGSNSFPVPHQSSSSVTAQCLLRNQQDNEYFASLLADKEKEANALMEAESLRLKEDKSQKRLLEEEKFERCQAAKGTSLPREPAIDDKNAVTLLVKMPDGSRHGRRFLKSDKLQFLYDFIDASRAVKPGTYRVVRAYPRRAFDVCDRWLSLNELGLSSKQEALFLEFI